MRLNLILQSVALGAWMDHLKVMGSAALSALLNVGLALLVALVVWGLAALAMRVVRYLLRGARFNEATRHLFGLEFLGAHEPAAIAAWAVHWLMIGAGLVIAADLLGFHVTESLADRLGDLMPRVLAAGIVLILGSVTSIALGAMTRRFFETAGLAGGRFYGQAATVLISLFTALLALDQLGFAAQFVMAIGVVLAASIGIALAIAFGLGCRELARDVVVEYLRSLERDERPRS
jgi:hypothetical protein